MKRLGLVLVLAVMAVVGLTGGAGAAGGKAPRVAISVSKVTTHSATVIAKVNPEGSETSYVIWVDPGCNVPACERAGPYEAKKGHVAARKGVTVISAAVRGLEEGTSNNETWVEATNASGTTKSRTRVFKTK